MVYLISWRGRGLVGLFAALLIPAGLGLGAMVGDHAMVLGLSVGFLAAGLLCTILAIVWNRANDIHRLGPFRLQTWGYVYLALGLLMLPAGINTFNLATPVHPVSRRG
ncbi:MAG: hypothetical protein ACTHLN_04760 [Tepidisphaeraceae bacterium]